MVCIYTLLNPACLEILFISSPMVLIPTGMLQYQTSCLTNIVLGLCKKELHFGFNFDRYSFKDFTGQFTSYTLAYMICSFSLAFSSKTLFFLFCLLKLMVTYSLPVSSLHMSNDYLVKLCKPSLPLRKKCKDTLFCNDLGLSLLKVLLSYNFLMSPSSIGALCFVVSRPFSLNNLILPLRILLA